MNLGAIIALLKLAKDAGLTPKAEFKRPSFFPKPKKDFVSIVVRPIYSEETALIRAEQGLGL